MVSGASRIVVTTADGREFQARVEGADADNDLAVLTVDAKNLRAAKLGTTADLLIGETVGAVGNPFGLSNTVTSGIVSAVPRTVQGETGRTYTDFIQTDAAINPGNSGGALANILGEMIGINTVIVGGANTIGFAIPVERARRPALQRQQRPDRVSRRPEPGPRDELRAPERRDGGRPGRLRLYPDVRAGVGLRGDGERY